jgi:hypothetical protein
MTLLGSQLEVTNNNRTITLDTFRVEGITQPRLYPENGKWPTLMETAVMSLDRLTVQNHA